MLIVSLLLFLVMKLISQMGNLKPPVEYVTSDNICNSVTALRYFKKQAQANKYISHKCSGRLLKDSVMTQVER